MQMISLPTHNCLPQEHIHVGEKVEQESSWERDHRCSERDIRNQMAQTFRFSDVKTGAKRRCNLYKIIQPQSMSFQYYYYCCCTRVYGHIYPVWENHSLKKLTSSTMSYLSLHPCVQQVRESLDAPKCTLNAKCSLFKNLNPFAIKALKKVNPKFSY